MFSVNVTKLNTFNVSEKNRVAGMRDRAEGIGGQAGNAEQGRGGGGGEDI